jgi:hypothetical protein
VPGGFEIVDTEHIGWWYSKGLIILIVAVAAFTVGVLKL